MPAQRKVIETFFGNGTVKDALVSLIQDSIQANKSVEEIQLLIKTAFGESVSKAVSEEVILGIKEKHNDFIRENKAEANEATNRIVNEELSIIARNYPEIKVLLRDQMLLSIQEALQENKTAEDIQSMIRAAYGEDAGRLFSVEIINQIKAASNLFYYEDPMEAKTAYERSLNETIERIATDHPELRDILNAEKHESTETLRSAIESARRIDPEIKASAIAMLDEMKSFLITSHTSDAEVVNILQKGSLEGSMIYMSNLGGRGLDYFAAFNKMIGELHSSLGNWSNLGQISMTEVINQLFKNDDSLLNKINQELNKQIRRLITSSYQRKHQLLNA